MGTENAAGLLLGGGSAPELTAREFELIRQLAFEKFGLKLQTGKEALVTARLSRNLRKHNFRSFREYYEFVRSDRTGVALQELIDALTTNFTNFMREPAHFRFLRERILPDMRRQPRIDIWSAACSSGEEPYSIAMTVVDALGAEANLKVRILATDICTDVLAKTREAVYPRERVAELPPVWQSRFFEPAGKVGNGWLRVKPELRRLVTVTQINLIEPFRLPHSFDVIFCRNVMIYFDRETQGHLVRRLEAVLRPGGYLMIGHAEGLTGIQHGLKYIAPSIFRKPSGEAAGAGGKQR